MRQSTTARAIRVEGVIQLRINNNGYWTFDLSEITALSLLCDLTNELAPLLTQRLAKDGQP